MDGHRDYVAIGKQYAEQVVAGVIPSCRWIRLACQRQLDDLARQGQPAFPYVFDEERAWHICKFIELLPHIEGRWKSALITLEPWQCFFLTCIFGWVHAETGFRRFRKALIVIPRKNAKSTIAAAIGLYLVAADGEPGAKVFSAATTRDQAKISWSIARKMAQRTAGFRSRYGVEPLAHSIVIETNAASFQPLSRDANTLEGLNPHGAVIDELHAHKTREVFDVLDEATGARAQSLIVVISTEGDNATGVFAEQVNYAQVTLDAKPEDRDESYFAVYYSIDSEDDWTDPTTWAKANPNLGVSVFEHDLALRCKQAQTNAGSQSSFLTKRLNVRVGAGDAYFSLHVWQTACVDRQQKLEQFLGKPCIAALDLASTTDIAAKLLLFQDDKFVRVFPVFYIPEDMVERGKPNYDKYRGWAEQGYLTLTPGSAIDYEFIERDLLEDRQRFDLLHVPYDPWNATQLAMRMEAEGLPMVKVSMNAAMLNEPMKELGARILAGRVKHDGNPVLAWMIGNVVAKIDANENVFPRKARPENKIDGAVALILALRMEMTMQEQTISYGGLKVIG